MSSNVLVFPGLSPGVNMRDYDPHDELVSMAMRYWGYRPDFLLVVPDTCVTTAIPVLSADYSFMGDRHLVYGFRYGEQHYVSANLRAHALAKAVGERSDPPAFYRLDDAYEYYEPLEVLP